MATNDNNLFSRPNLDLKIGTIVLVKDSNNKLVEGEVTHVTNKSKFSAIIDGIYKEVPSVLVETQLSKTQIKKEIFQDFAFTITCRRTEKIGEEIINLKTNLDILAERWRNNRARMKLTQLEVAKIVGVTSSNISTIEAKGKVHATDTLFRLVKLYGEDMLEIIALNE